MDYDIFFEEYFNEPIKTQAIINACCNNPSIITDNGTNVCINCGISDGVKLFGVSTDNTYDLKRQYYKRLSYFREKIKLLACIKRSNSNNYEMLIEILRADIGILKIQTHIKNLDYNEVIRYFIEINIIRDIRKRIRYTGYTKLLKYVYCIILDLFDIQIFKITNANLYTMSCEWINFEIRFRKLKRLSNNMISYNVILKNVLTKHNIANVELLNMPYNTNKVESIFIKII
jgi:hypothetical protein